jgi:hypothetical protein
MTVAQTFPASRDTVEKSAAPNASPNPTNASRNFTHTSAEADCSHCAIRLGTEELGFTGLTYAEATRSEPSIPRQNGQSTSAVQKSVRNRKARQFFFRDCVVPADDAADGTTTALSLARRPHRSTGYVRHRRVPHPGFAAVQDDIIEVKRITEVKGIVRCAGMRHLVLRQLLHRQIQIIRLGQDCVFQNWLIGHEYILRGDAAHGRVEVVE